MQTAKIVVSEKLELNSYDWKSALRGLYLMWGTTTGLFLIGILERVADDPSCITTIDWKVTGVAYLGAVGASFATFGINLIKKYLQANEYIK